MKNVIDAKVVKEEGAFVCTISEGKQGTIACDTGGKPVVNVIEAKQGSLPMTITVSFTGRGSTRFTIVSDGRMKVAAGDMSGLDVTAKAVVGGQEIPFPAKEMFTLFGSSEGALSYRCEDGALALKPEAEGVDTSWQHMKPAP